MNNNKHDLRVGQIVWLDFDNQNKSEVAIYAFSSDEIYANVYAKNETSDMWWIMTNRLSPIEIRFTED